MLLSPEGMELKEADLCSVPPEESNWFMKSNSRLVWRLILHVASLSVPTTRSKVKRGETPKGGFTSLISRGLEFTVKLDCAVMEFPEKSLALIVIFLLPSAIVIVALYSILSAVVKFPVKSCPLIAILSMFTFLLNFIVIDTGWDFMISPSAGIIDTRAGTWSSITISALNMGLIKIPLLFLALSSNVYSPGFICLGNVNSVALPSALAKSGIIAISVPFSKSLALVTMAFSKNSVFMTGFFELV